MATNYKSVFTDNLSASFPRAQYDDPVSTSNGSPRAKVSFENLKTLWVNTGTLCNLSCPHCYISSSPTNDRLLYPSLADITPYFDEIKKHNMPTEEIGFTGGEPFMNPHIIPLIEESLKRGFNCLILTNAMQPMMKRSKQLLFLKTKFGNQLRLRVSVDHYSEKKFSEERGVRAWKPMCLGLNWLKLNGFNFNIAARKLWDEPETEIRTEFQLLFKELGLSLDAFNLNHLVIFPEMEEGKATTEITESCWDILGVSPNQIMCSNSRMIIKRKGTNKTSVMPCTLIPYEKSFELGSTLQEAKKTIHLNHPNCSNFCVLGGGSCSK